MHPPPATRTRGFTLMELLIVIMIIGILAGLLFPAIMIARGASQKAKTRAIIANIEAAADKFRTQNGAYPEAAIGTNGETFVTRLATVDSDTFGPTAPNIVTTPHPDPTLPAIPVAVTDAWGTAIVYQPFEDYALSAGASSPITADDDPPPNPDSFQVWSLGPNMKDERGAGDDLNNWSD